jgi:hypothetical protein
MFPFEKMNADFHPYTLPPGIVSPSNRTDVEKYCQEMKARLRNSIYQGIFPLEMLILHDAIFVEGDDNGRALLDPLKENKKRHWWDEDADPEEFPNDADRRVNEYIKKLEKKDG